MFCGPYQAAGNQSKAAYERGIMGEVPTYRERQKEQFQCGDCGEDMAAGSVAGHNMTQHGQALEAQRIWKHRPRGMSRGIIEWSFRPRDARGAARWRDARDERQQGL